ncbi:putative N-succinyldiaminopimelate aminotransferase DapC isoform X2 [Canna indica]|uniref:N-succinyldiaminopimelate aminotransferase DapC isoform X2 n=1 Tax=Canna indica TaxID=4628 RepID=A0AAQ3KG23_9LILI|nr:putative N-succinyldiaminopimelate aminotransferase DapC isoform X2 [Canna indica]
MEAKLSKASRTLSPSPIQELSHLAQRCGAINLAEGFPDFPAPPHLKHAAVAAINADFNQYRHVQGICDLLGVIMKQNHGLDVNPLTDFVICCGQSEAFAATIFATIDQGDEVLIFDPAYETYESCIILAGGIPVYVPLDPPYWTLNVDKFMSSFTKRTKAVVLNSPHNPTGKVFCKEELEAIAATCCQMDCLAITDEVYEYITFDTHKHISLASLPRMQERTIITSSLSKTFSVTANRLEDWLGLCTNYHRIWYKKCSYQDHRFSSCAFPRSCLGSTAKPTSIL